MALPEYPRARVYASDNYNERPSGMPISAIVLHATVGEAGPSLAWLSNPDSFVSVHYLIDRDGTVYQMVSESLRAWHAGPSSYNGLSDWNNFSVGIEMVNRNDGIDPYAPALVESCRQLCIYLVSKYGIQPNMVVTHAMISGALIGKTDPKGFPLKEFIMSSAPQIPNEVRLAAWRSLGIDYNPDAMLQKKAREWGMGRPVTNELRVVVNGVRWAYQGFDGGILACVEGEWQNVRKLDWLG